MNSDKPLTIEICKPGSFTSAEGKKISFTLADLSAMVAAYDPVLNQAPAVVGHPQMDDPAFAWADSLQFADDRVTATFEQVDASFAEMIADGRFKKVSPQFYPPEHPNNPAPGSFYLKHIGFLGAAAPAIKGLRPVSFAEDAANGCITIEISNTHKEANMPKDEEVSFAERIKALDEREAALAASEAEVKTTRDALDKEARDNRHAAHVSFAESQIAAGKLAPAAKDQAIFVMDALADAGSTLSFAEGDAEYSPVAVFQKMLVASGAVVSFGEMAKGDAKKSSVVSFAAPAGFEIDAAQLEHHNRALALQAENPQLSYADAVKRAA